MNPVRAGMIPDPGVYPYSSYRHNALGEDDPIVTPRVTYTGLGDSTVEIRKAYRRLFESELDRKLLDTIRSTTDACCVLGNTGFTDQIEAMLNRRVRPTKMGRPCKTPPT